MSKQIWAELNKMREAVAQEIADEGEAVLKQEFGAFFTKHPKVLAIRWEQYTPHFNDGEACEFGVNDFTFRTAETNDAMEDPDELEDDELEFDDGYGEGSDEKTMKFVRDLQSRVVDDDVFEAVFGDHVRVTATPDGFEVEEYDHD